jgi:hypothetical protein
MAYQEYPWREEEAFLVGGTCMFDIEALQAMPIRLPEGYLDNAEIFVPPSSGHTYSAGVDTALGITKRDYSVLNLIDDETYEVVAKLRGLDRFSAQHLPIEKFSEEAYALLSYYNYPLVAVEEQGQGLTFYRIMKENKYPMHRFYHSSKTTPCWRSTAVTRRNVLSELEQSIRTHQLNVFSEHTVAEMLGFGYDEKKDKFVGLSGNDDEVISLALANKMHIDKAPAWNADSFQSHSYIDGGSSIGQLVSMAEINWHKADPMKGLEAIPCPTCSGERMLKGAPCRGCRGLGKVLLRVE